MWLQQCSIGYVQADAGEYQIIGTQHNWKLGNFNWSIPTSFVSPPPLLCLGSGSKSYYESIYSKLFLHHLSTARTFLAMILSSETNFCERKGLLLS